MEAAYVGSALFERRRTLMDDYARYLDQGTGEDLEPVEEGDPWILPLLDAEHRTGSSNAHHYSLYYHPKVAQILLYFVGCCRPTYY